MKFPPAQRETSLAHGGFCLAKFRHPPTFPRNLRPDFRLYILDNKQQNMPSTTQPQQNMNKNMTTQSITNSKATIRIASSIQSPAIFRWMLLLAVLIIPQVVQAQWNANVGAQSDDKGHQALAFLPNEIWIHAGDSITWRWGATEIHTVTFLKADQPRPFFADGCPGFSTDPATYDGSTCVTTDPFALKRKDSFTVIFPVAGNFKLVCLVHENMTGAVHVLALDQPLPHNQDFYDAQAKKEREAVLSDSDNTTDSEDHAVVAGIGEVSATAGGSDTLSVYRFMEDKIQIHAGQTVQWANQDPITPHTITFGPDPADPVPPSADVTVDPDGARHAIIDSTSDRTHSGFIIAAPQERLGLPQAPLGVTRFRVTFPNAGTFPYQCALHDFAGMKGVVFVSP
jgi:plastocyanin